MLRVDQRRDLKALGASSSHIDSQEPRCRRRTDRELVLVATHLGLEVRAALGVDQELELDTLGAGAVAIEDLDSQQ